MARPQKIGLDYFSLDVSLDDKIELMEAECGLAGFAVLIKLWQKIYAEGYYIDWEEDHAMLFARKINAELSLVNSVITSCLNREIFNKELYEKYRILTSKGIQKRYLLTYRQLKRSYIPMDERYLLVNSELTSVITELTPINPEISTQSKVEESKVNKSKVNESSSIDTADSKYEYPVAPVDATSTKQENEPVADMDAASIQQDKIASGNHDLQRIENYYKQEIRKKNTCSGKDLGDMVYVYEKYNKDIDFILSVMETARNDYVNRYGKLDINSFKYFLPILEERWNIRNQKLIESKPRHMSVKKTRFHNFEQRSDKYSADQLNKIAERKRREYSQRLREQKGD